MTTDIIPKAANILLELSKKPQEQIHFTEDTIPILMRLQSRGLAHTYTNPRMPEHNIWSITPRGLDWLHRHGFWP